MTLWNPTEPDFQLDDPKRVHPRIEKWILSITRSCSLGTTPPPFIGPSLDGNLLFITISPPSGYKVECSVTGLRTGKRAVRKIPYERLSHRNQQHWLKRYFMRVYAGHLDSYIGVFELNKSSVLHLHLLAIASDVKSEYDLLCFRDTINKNPYSLVVVNKPKLFSIFNNIVYVTPSLQVTCEYLSKDLHKSFPHFGVLSPEDDSLSNIPNVDLLFE